MGNVIKVVSNLILISVMNINKEVTTIKTKCPTNLYKY